MFGEQRPLTDEQRRQQTESFQREWDEKYAPLIDEHADEIRAHYDSLSVKETEEALLRITIAELPAPFSELTPEEYKDLQARHLARSAQNLTEVSSQEPANDKYDYLNGLALSDPSKVQSKARKLSQRASGTKRSGTLQPLSDIPQERGLYEDLTIQDPSRSQPQPRIFGGMPSGGRW